jgi:diguanylate cyclase (GGDEF)-like protein
VNDSSGHLAGDLVLAEVARRLRACLRAADTIARSGGDEFILILENILQEKDVSATVERILQSMARPFEVDTNRFYLSASMGICLYPDDSLTLDGLLVAADSAMYQAKRSGKNQCWYASHGVDGWLALHHPDQAVEGDES